MNQKYESSYFDGYREISNFTQQPRGKMGLNSWLRLIRRLVSSDSRVCEVGCGLGYFADAARKHFDYSGIDVSADAIEWGHQHLALQGFTREGDANELDEPNNSADALIALDVAEHLQHPEYLFQEAHRILKPKGYFIMRVPNTESFGVRVKSGRPGLTPSMHTDTTHVSLNSPRQWRSLLEASGFRIVDEGTDTLWDIPYTTRIPVFLQKAVLIPINTVLSLARSYWGWRYGENLILIARRN